MSTDIVSTTYLVFSLGYAIWILLLIKGLSRLRPQFSDWRPRVSVIIPARNEEDNIRSCLYSALKQTYPVELFEVIVVDDCSTDDTKMIVKSVQRDFSNLKLLALSPDLSISCSPKKQAIQLGITNSRGDVILTTDADCLVPPTWIQTMIHQFDDDTGVVCGLVKIANHAGMFPRIQSLETFAILLAGAGTIGLGKPIIGNGANLAYRRVTFDQVGGFAEIDHLTSGDDDLLIQKIHNQGRWKIAFSPTSDSLVTAKPCQNLREFFQQRLRWASKALRYGKVSHVISMILLYCFYGLLLSGSLVVLTTDLTLTLYLLCLLTKLIFDFFLISQGLHLVKAKTRIIEFLFAELGQLLYIVIVGPATLLIGFEWKGRRYKK